MKRLHIRNLLQFKQLLKVTPSLIILALSMGDGSAQATTFELRDNIQRNEQGLRGRFYITEPGRAPYIEFLPIVEVQQRGFTHELPIEFNPQPQEQPLEAVGTARRRVRCTVLHNGNQFLSKKATDYRINYPVQGQWVYQEDPDHTQTLAFLNLRIRLEDLTWHDLAQRAPIPLRWVPGNHAPEQPAGLYFNGEEVYQRSSILQAWRNYRDEERNTNIFERRGLPASHEGYILAHVEPFTIGEDEQRARHEFIGQYNYRRPLIDGNEIHPRINTKTLIYSDGEHIYHPHVTQELWEQNDHRRAGFLIASYRPDRRLQFFGPQARIVNHDMFPEGLYELQSVTNQNNEDTENWRKIDQDPQDPLDIQLVVPSGVSSIPGMRRYLNQQHLDIQPNLEARELQEAIQDIVQRIRVNAVDSRVIVIGPARIGKTSLIHGFAGIGFEAQETEEDGIIGFRLEPARRLEGSNINHDDNAGTLLPWSWNDPEHNLIFWDCPGFKDPRGPFHDIVNAYAIDQLFRNDAGVKVLLAVSEEMLVSLGRTQFLQLLERMTNLIQNDQQLYQAISLVITKQQNIRNIAALLQRLIATPPGGNALLQNPRIRGLLEFLAHNAQQRISDFPSPVREGAYIFNPDPTLATIANSHAIVNPAINIPMTVEDRQYTFNLAQDINGYIRSYLRTTTSQNILNHCLNQVDNHNGPVAGLRANIRNIAADLRALKRLPANEATYTQRLNRFHPEPLVRAIRDLAFLRTLNDGINFDVEGWRAALRDTRKKVKTLAAVPEREMPDQNNPILRIKGVLVGASDINNALNEVNAPFNRIEVFGLDTLFLDQDIEQHGKSLSLIAPSWKVVNACSINLSGLPGVNLADAVGQNLDGSGQDGRPGNPGENGGHFFGKGFKFNNLERLIVNTNGGRAGDGQRGGIGADGDIGQDASGNLRHNISSTCALEGNMRSIGATSEGGKINSISIRSGNDVDFLTFNDPWHLLGTIMGRSTSGIGNPFGGGAHPNIILNSNEKIIEISGYSYEILHQIKFVTNIGKVYGPYGTPKGNPFCFRQDYSEIIGMHVANKDIDTIPPRRISSHLGVIYKQATLSQPETPGSNGKPGGKGGRGGIGGHPGNIILEGANLNPNQLLNAPGGEGLNGGSGNGGRAGVHGRPYLGYRGLQPSSLPALEPGQTPTDLNAVGQQQPDAPIPLDRNASVERFEGYYLQQAADQITAPLLSVVPDLQPHEHAQE